MSLIPFYKARLARALRAIDTLGVYAPEWAWIDRNLYERLIAAEAERRDRNRFRRQASRMTAARSKSWLTRFMPGREAGLSRVGEAG